MAEGKFKPEWFNNNADAIEIYRLLCKLADTWDNLIDKDKPVSDEEINECFLTCLFRLPLNPVYRQLEQHIAPMWLTVITSYEAANSFEEERDERGIEMAHMLRYSAGNIVSYIMSYCLGRDAAKKYIPEMWTLFVRERYDEYKNDRLAITEGEI